MRTVGSEMQPGERFDDYMILCYLAPCGCREMGSWFAGDGVCTRFGEVSASGDDEDMLQRHMTANAATYMPMSIVNDIASREVLGSYLLSETAFQLCWFIAPVCTK